MILHSSTEIEIGRTGEFFTLFALAKQGFQCCLSAQMLPYDIVVDIGDMVLRGQVKSTLRYGDFGGAAVFIGSVCGAEKDQRPLGKYPALTFMLLLLLKMKK